MRRQDTALVAGAALVLAGALAGLGGCILLTDSPDDYTPSEDAGTTEAAALFRVCPSEAGCAIECVSKADCLVDGDGGEQDLVCCFGQVPDSGGVIGSSCLPSCGSGLQLCKQSSECGGGTKCLEESCYVDIDLNFCGACPSTSLL